MQGNRKESRKGILRGGKMTRTTTINNADITIHGEIGDTELQFYLEIYQELREEDNPSCEKMTRAVVTIEGQDVKIQGYDSNGTPFERIRRITGYLTGTTDGWNNAKRAEEKDRVKHGMGGGR
jgi:hypothetical protein